MSTTIPQWMADEVAQYDLDLVNNPTTVLDIGANIGAFSLRAHERWPAAKIFAYEPVARNAAQFAVNCGLDNPGMITLMTQAVRNFDGPAQINIGDMGVVCGFHQLGRSTGVQEAVGCVDAAHLPAAEFIKIDTEGCELEIVQRLDLSKAIAVVCESHRGDWTEIAAVLEKAGLVLHSRTPSEQKPATHGLMKYARPGSVRRPAELADTNPIPDDTNVTGKTKDGVLFTMPAAGIRNPFYRPSLRGKKLFVGLPVYQQMPTFFVQCLMAFAAQKPCPIDVRICQGDGVARSRNGLTAEFLKSDCTHLLFIDSDLIFSADHVTSLLERNVPVVGGFYPKKQQGALEWVINTLPGTPPMREDGLQPLRYVGTGFMCIAREVFEKMIVAYPEIEFMEDYNRREKAWDFWSMGVYTDKVDRSRRYLSEDWFFCQRWLDMGGEIFGDCSVALKHYGPAIFPLVTQEPEMRRPAAGVLSS